MVEDSKSMDANQFDQLMLPYVGLFTATKNKALAIACSGGADSMALSVLLHQWCDTQNISLHALIVDHKLRPESADEAKTVSGRLTSLGIENHILSGLTQSIDSNIQSKARDLRYQLLTQWCEENDVKHLTLAHHKQDQAETFLLRLGRGSGVAGLGAMRDIEERDNLTLLRPLLQSDKVTLTDYLRQKDIDWVEDPSNQLQKFGRVRIRELSESLEREGISADRLSKTASLMRKNQDALDWAMVLGLKSDLKIYDVGAYSVSLEALFALPEILGLRTLSLLVKSTAGQVYPPRLEKMESLYHALKNSENPKHAVNSFGAQMRMRNGRLWIGREVAKVSSEHMLGDHTFKWDGRFMVPKVVEASGVKIAALGLSGWQEWAGEFGKGKDDCLYPSFVRQAVPALFLENELIAPIASLFGEDVTEIIEKVGQYGIKFKIPSEFRDFTFSSASSDTM